MTESFDRVQLRLLAAVAAADFATRIAIVRPGSFQFSDGIRLMDWTEAAASKVQPLFPALVSVVRTIARDPVLSAGLTASSFGALAVFPLFFLARRLYGTATGWLAVALYSVNFFLYAQSAGVTANPVLVFAMLLAILSFLRLIDPPEGRSARPHGTAPVVFWAGVAALARPEGMLLWPLAAAAVVLALVRRQPVRATLLLGAAPYAVWLLWNFGPDRGFEYGQEIVLGAEMSTFEKFGRYLLAYLREFSAGLFHVYTVAAAVGLALGMRRGGRSPGRRAWHLLLAYALTAVLVVLSLHWAFVPRLLAPIQVLALLPAAFALDRLWRRGRIARGLVAGLLALTLVFSAGIAVTLVRRLHEIGADIRAGAQALGALAGPGERIASDLPVETRFYSGLPVESYDRQAVQPGQIVVLHNIQTDLAAEVAALSESWVVETLAERTAPYVPPEEGGLPIARDGVYMMDLPAREKPLAQEPYRTVILRLGARP